MFTTGGPWGQNLGGGGGANSDENSEFLHAPQLPVLRDNNILKWKLKDLLTSFLILTFQLTCYFVYLLCDLYMFSYVVSSDMFM